MEYKWLLLALGILLILLFVYKNRHRILGFFGIKSKKEPALVEQPPNNIPSPPLQDEHIPPSQEYVVLNIASSPEEGKEMEIGDLYIQLHDDICPRTCENFRSLSKIEYKGCIIHRMIPGFMLQTGDYEKSNGTGGESVFGPKFPDENFILKHNKRGIVAMANSGPNTNGSQFYVTFEATPHLDGKHVVFGEVVKGFDVLDIIEKMPTRPTDEPVQPLYIKGTRITNRLN